MRKPLIALVALGLVAGAVAAPAQAKKKKPKPKPPVAAPVQMDQTYYLVNTSDGCLPEDMFLALAPAEGGSSCGSRIAGPPATVLAEAGDTPCTPDSAAGVVCAWQTYTAAEGLPVTLDATKKLTGKIIVKSGKGVAQNPASLGAGPTTFNMALDATANGQTVVLGTFSSDYTVTPDKDTYEVPFEIALDAALDKAEISALSVRLWNTGPASQHGYYEVNTSSIVLPIWKLAS